MYSRRARSHASGSSSAIQAIFGPPACEVRVDPPMRVISSTPSSAVMRSICAVERGVDAVEDGRAHGFVAFVGEQDAGPHAADAHTDDLGIGDSGEQFARDRDELVPPDRGVHLDPARARAFDVVRPGRRRQDAAVGTDQHALAAGRADVHPQGAAHGVLLVRDDGVLGLIATVREIDFMPQGASSPAPFTPESDLPTESGFLADQHRNTVTFWAPRIRLEACAWTTRRYGR